jgi:hypothetical protein
LNAGYNFEPPEAQSIKSMYHIVRILAIIFGILLFLGGLAYVGLLVAAYDACQATIDCVGYAGGLGFVIFPALILVIFGLVDIIIYIKMKSLEAMVNNRQYDQAKHDTLIWMILGFILGGIIIGILLLIAYIKFDPLIAAARAGPPQGQWGQPQQQQQWAPPGQMGQPPQPGQWGAPPQTGWGQPSAPMAAGKTCASCGTLNAAGAQFCAKCGAALPP